MNRKGGLLDNANNLHRSAPTFNPLTDEVNNIDRCCHEGVNWCVTVSEWVVLIANGLHMNTNTKDSQQHI